MAKSINQRLFFNHTPNDVWEYLTKPELLELWLMKSDIQPTVGHQFRFHTTPMPNFGFDGIIYCTVLEVVPSKRLSYSWKGGPGDGTFNLDSVVLWTLIPKDGGTELQLEHSGFDEENSMRLSVMSEGWLRNMGRIGELLDKQKNAPAA